MRRKWIPQITTKKEKEKKKQKTRANALLTAQNVTEIGSMTLKYIYINIYTIEPVWDI